MTSDALASPRVITDNTGNIVSRHDYMAFGEEISRPNYGTDSVRDKYTGYERDNESGLDYAQARYYNSKNGRFTSVDPLTASANIKNPQTFNRYSYGLNSPYKFTDPLGLISQSTGVCPAQFSSCEKGGDGEVVKIKLNIIYDKNQYSDAKSAKAAVEDTVADAQRVYGAINVEFDITYLPGSANEKDSTDCPTCPTRITEGAVEGEINVFLQALPSNSSNPMSYFYRDSAQIFLLKAVGKSFGKMLAHELGHLFRFFGKGSPDAGIKIPVPTGNGWNWADASNITEDWIIDIANDRLRQGGLEYGSDYVDDYRIDPSRDRIVNDYEVFRWGAKPRIVRTPTAADAYRLGARIVAAQKK